MKSQQRFNVLMEDLKNYRLALQLGGMSEEETAVTEIIVKDIELELAEDYGFGISD